METLQTTLSKSFIAKGSKNMSGNEDGRWSQGFVFGFKVGKIAACWW